jgi:coenzyme F420-reducing hydrogenase delta subunit
MGWFSRGETQKLKNAINKFIKDLEKLGPINESFQISLW